MGSFDYTLCLPFVPGFSENLKRELKKQGIRVAFREGQTLESLLCRLKFREPITNLENLSQSPKTTSTKGIARLATSPTLERQANTRNAEIEDIEML